MPSILSSHSKRKVFVLETITVTPHTETGVEIAHHAARGGMDVIYCPMFLSLSNSYFFSPPGGFESNSFADVSIYDRNAWKTIWLDYIKHNLPCTANVIDVIGSSPSLELQLRYTDFLAFRFDDLPFGELVIRFLAELTRTNFVSMEEVFFQKIALYAHSLLGDSIRTYEATKSCSNLWGDGYLVLFNGRTPSTRAALWAAQKYGASVVFHERGPNSRTFELFTEPASHPASLGKVISDFSRRRDEAEFISKSSATKYFKQLYTHNSIAWHSFTKHQEVFRGQKNENFKDHVVFFLSSQDEYDSIIGAEELGFLGDQFATLRAVGEANKAIGRKLIVKSHPSHKEKTAEFKQFEFLCREIGAKLVPPDDTLNSLELGVSCHCVLTYGSSISWQLSFEGAPVGLLARSVGSGFPGVVELKSITDIISFIEVPPMADSRFAVAYGDYYQNGGIPFEWFQTTGLFSGHY